MLTKLFRDTRCIIAMALTLVFAIGIFVLDSDNLAAIKEIILVVLAFYFGARTSEQGGCNGKQ